VKDCAEVKKIKRECVERQRLTTCRRWNYSGVIVDRKLLQKRIRSIEAAAKNYPAVQLQQFSEEGDWITRRAERVPAVGAPGGSKLLKSLELLAERLDLLTIDDVVHGDIKRANLIWDGLQWVLIDWEPVLVWRTADGQTVFRVTRPHLHPDDFKNKSVSQYTDKTGFYFFVRTMLNGWQNITAAELQDVQVEATKRTFLELVRKISIVSNNK
jgi:hypothetical protein